MPVRLNAQAVTAHDAAEATDADAADWPVRAGELDQLDLPAGLAEAGGFKGELGQTQLLPTADGLRVLVGLGKEPLTVADIRRCAGELYRSARKLSSVATSLAATAAEAGVEPAAALSAVAEGVRLASYEFKATPRPDGGRPVAPRSARDGSDAGSSGEGTQGDGNGDAGDLLSTVRIERPAELDADVATAALRAADATVGGIALARDLVNQPAGALNATQLTQAAVAALPTSDQPGGGTWSATFWGREQLAVEGCGGMLGVNAGSEAEPQMLRITYVPAGSAGSPNEGEIGGETDGETGEPPTSTTPPDGAVWLIGKGITFDTGGLNLKTFEGMSTMKTDMGGSAAVAGAMAAIVRLQPNVPVVGVMCCTDNQPSATAVMPGDVLSIRNGKTVEVLNTDAEGRLVLADGLSLAAEHQPRAVVDLATLTGACLVALGSSYAGLMGNDDDLIDAIRSAADGAGEQVWHLPLPADYRKQLDSEVADLRNIGKNRYGGALVAGLFLQEFAGDHPWAHLDIAGPVTTDEASGERTKGATGFGVRTLVDWVSSL